MGIKTSKSIQPPRPIALEVSEAPDTPTTPTSTSSSQDDQFELNPSEPVDRNDCDSSASDSSTPISTSCPSTSPPSESLAQISLLSLLSLPPPASTSAVEDEVKDKVEAQTKVDAKQIDWEKQVDEWRQKKQIGVWKHMEVEAVEGDSLLEKRATFFSDFRDYLKGNHYPLIITVQKPPKPNDDNNYAGVNVDGKRHLEHKIETNQSKVQTFRVKLLQQLCGPFRMSFGLLAMDDDETLDRDELGRVRELVLRWIPQHGHFVFDEGIHTLDHNANANANTRVQIEIGQVMEINVMTDFWLHWASGYGNHWRQDFLATYGSLDNYKYANVTITFKDDKHVDGPSQSQTKLICKKLKRRRSPNSNASNISSIDSNAWIEASVAIGKMTVDAGMPITTTPVPPTVNPSRYDEISDFLTKKNATTSRLCRILTLELVAAEERFNKSPENPLAYSSEQSTFWETCQATMVVSFHKLLSLEKFVVSYELRCKAKVPTVPSIEPITAGEADEIDESKEVDAPQPVESQSSSSVPTKKKRKSRKGKKCAKKAKIISTTSF